MSNCCGGVGATVTPQDRKRGAAIRHGTVRRPRDAQVSRLENAPPRTSIPYARTRLTSNRSWRRRYRT
jgi:hypothetical protein